MSDLRSILCPHAPEPIGPYSQAIVVGELVFVSGQLPIRAGEKAYTPAPVEEETQIVLENLKAILTEAGSGSEHVIKCSIFLRSMAEFSKVNEVYGTYFSQHKPARETVEVSQLPLGVKVEISCIARIA
ncbi:MAG: Rid family detoxifying hydrolase [Cytophagales bacterium]|nr:Rid family detoxifying hydrolase [Cytophagales bacterium]